MVASRLDTPTSAGAIRRSLAGFNVSSYSLRMAAAAAFKVKKVPSGAPFTD